MTNLVDSPDLNEIDLSGWTVLNDTIMGGSSEAFCNTTNHGVTLEGNLIEEGGGFVSCRSPIFCPPLNLSSCNGLKIQIDGGGRTFKIAVACSHKKLDISRFLTDSLRWVAEVPTNVSGTTTINILFSALRPTVRAKKIFLPLKFNSSSITQIQLLHSKFGMPGQLNEGFKAGPIKVLLRSISGVF